MERAPDEFADIRDTYLKYREQRASEGRTHAMTIFDAREELKSRTGLDDITLSREFQRLSVRLIRENPLDYLKGVSKAWAGFFTAPVYWNPKDATSDGAARLMDAIGVSERWVIRAGYAVFLLAAVPAMWVAWIRRRGQDPGWNTLSLLASVVLATSLLQALLEYGENGRYALPTQSLAMAAAVAVIALAWRRIREGTPARDPFARPQP
jgi:hypothetical protein